MWYYGRMKESQYPQVLKRKYRRRMRETLNLEHPRKFSEKMQWLKLYDSTPLKTMLADKYLVRQWVADTIGAEYLIPLLGVWSDANDIDFDTLPEKFVLKANHGSKFNIIVRDKSKLNFKKTKKTLNLWLKYNYTFTLGRCELHYKDIKPLIIAEQYIENIDNDLVDHKFFCFHGSPKYYAILQDRAKNIKSATYDINFIKQPFMLLPGKSFDFEKPESFEKMLSIAEILCQGFKHVRVDLYDVKGKIYFGEMTFTSGSGFRKIRPIEYDYMLGDLIKISE